MLRIVIAIVAVIGLTVGVLLLGVKLIPEEVLRARFVQEAQEVVGRSLVVGGSTRLAVVPAPRLVVDEVVMTEGGPRVTVDRAVVALAPWSWLGGGRLVESVYLDGLRVSAETGDGATLLGLLPELALPNRLVLENGRLILRDGGRSRIRAADARLRFERRADGVANLDGMATVNGLAVNVTAVFDPPAPAPDTVDRVPAVRSGRARPVDLTVAATDARMVWQGAVAAGVRDGRIAEIDLDGRLALTVRQPAQLARRLGFDMPVAATPGAIELNGRIERSRRRLVLDDLQARIGESAAGVSLIALGDGTGSEINGSVAWRRFDLPGAAAFWAALPPSWRAALTGRQPVAGQLAVTAETITLARGSLRDLAAMLDLGVGGLDATVSRLSLGGGSATGDLAWIRPASRGRGRLQATARFDAVDLDRLWRELAVPVSLAGMLSGEAALSVDPWPIAGGEEPGGRRPRSELLAALAGRGEMRISDARFMTPGRPARPAAPGRSAVILDRVDARLTLADGVVRIWPIGVRAGPVTLAGTGEIDLAALNVAIDLAPAGDEPLGTDEGAETLGALGIAGDRLRIEGPLQSPQIGAAEDADRPAGGGAPVLPD